MTTGVHMALDGDYVAAADVKSASRVLVMTVSYRGESPFLSVPVMSLGIRSGVN